MCSVDSSPEREHYLYKFSNSIISTIIAVGLSNTKEVNAFEYGFPNGASSFGRLVRLMPGTLPHIVGSYSDLYRYDVFSAYKTYNKLVLRFIETTAAKIKQTGTFSSSKPLITTDFYTTISGGDVCVGDETPPYITYISPVASGTNLRPRNQNVSFSLGDLVGGVDLSTVAVSLDSTTSGTISLVSAGSDQTGGLVSIIGDSASYLITYTPNFLWDFNDSITVTISGSDFPPILGGNPFYCGLAGVNLFAGDIKFKILNQSDFGATITAEGDVSPPYILSAVPSNGSTDNEVFSPIVLTIADDLTGISLGSVSVTIDGAVVILDGIPQTTEVTIVGSPAAYTITYVKETSYTYGSTVIVEVYAEDRVAVPNVLDTSYAFSFLSNSSLRIENFLPPVGTSVNPWDIDIQVDVVDDTYGVDDDLSFLVVNGTIVDATKTVITSGIRFTYHPPNDFAFEEPIRVKVHGQSDSLPQVIVKENLYTLFYGYRYLVHNQDPFAREVPIDVFVRATNIQALTKDLATGYYFTTYSQPASNFGASITPITPWSDLQGSIVGVGPEHRYGATVTVTFYVRDYEGHELGPYTFNYMIENSPE
jgi:hypothetical protein